jgi:hypothetical protein
MYLFVLRHVSLAMGRSGSQDYWLHGCPTGLSERGERGQHLVCQRSEVIGCSPKGSLRIEDHPDRHAFK